MYKQAKPSKSVHISGAPYATHPGSIAISPKVHVVLPSHGSVWSGATIIYVVIASLMLFMFWWAVTNPVKREPFDDSAIKTMMFGSYLLVGLAIAMMFSYHKNTMYSWIIALGLLAPAVIVLFWVAYHYRVIESADDQE